MNSCFFSSTSVCFIKESPVIVNMEVPEEAVIWDFGSHAGWVLQEWSLAPSAVFRTWTPHHSQAYLRQLY